MTYAYSSDGPAGPGALHDKMLFDVGDVLMCTACKAEEAWYMVLPLCHDDNLAFCQDCMKWFKERLLHGEVYDRKCTKYLRLPDIKWRKL